MLQCSPFKNSWGKITSISWHKSYSLSSLFLKPYPERSRRATFPLTKNLNNHRLTIHPSLGMPIVLTIPAILPNLIHSTMKKIFLFLFMSIAICGISVAQTDSKVKRTSTVPQKVHNTFSKHKRYNGTVVKTNNGHHKRKHKHTTRKNIIKHHD
jgi:hypothetical protein